ncbi:hypothetical protein C9374_013802 [Naegleria lovaniensis]|uniref:Uncharacterized protein n=1 Tax=Naegleria lovaniensis TaxID=51637 RepID=A0AA88GBK9_NAELO|nr:uncharacterized protein C9374_013802 [Naegleria lovaniensis]KAG2370846.1 hypothetical protein C9374_013802 [Naegleria lovaniensis]
MLPSDDEEHVKRLIRIRIAPYNGRVKELQGRLANLLISQRNSRELSIEPLVVNESSHDEAVHVPTSAASSSEPSPSISENETMQQMSHVKEDNIESLVSSQTNDYFVKVMNSMQPFKKLSPEDENDLSSNSAMHKEIINQLSNVERGYKLVKYALNANTKLRHVILLLSQNIVPHSSTMKRCIYSDANYGSYVNAEMALILFVYLFDMKIYDWQNQSDVTNLFRSFNSVIRYSPNASLAMFYFELFQFIVNSNNSCEKRTERNIPAVAYNIALCLSDHVDSNDSVHTDLTDTDTTPINKEMQELIDIIEYYNNMGFKFFNNSTDENRMVFFGVRKVCRRRILEISNTRSTYRLENGLFVSEEDNDDDTVSAVTGLSSTETSLIELLYDDLALRSMKLREIEEIEVKRCVKHGDIFMETGKSKQDSSTYYKACDGNLIVFYSRKSKIPNIMNVYRTYTMEQLKKKQQDAKSHLIACCDTILTSTMYGNYMDCVPIIQDMLRMDPDGLTTLEKEALKEVINVIFTDTVPTYDEALKIIALMQHFKISF